MAGSARQMICWGATDPNSRTDRRFCFPIRISDSKAVVSARAVRSNDGRHVDIAAPDASRFVLAAR
jgi:hypothetical protein